MNNVSLVMTVLGKDRPGLVGLLAQAVADNSGNWLESQMAHLAGQFAGIVRVEVPQDQAKSLTDALHALDDLQVELVTHADVAPTLSDKSPPAVRLELVGQDRPGLVREITQVLTAAGVNVEKFQTERTTAANTGQLLFQATAQLHIPSSVSQAELRDNLEHLAADLMVEITLQ